MAVAATCTASGRFKGGSIVSVEWTVAVVTLDVAVVTLDVAVVGVTMTVAVGHAVAHQAVGPL